MPLFSTTIILCDPSRIYPSLPVYTLLFNQFICTTLPESTPPFKNIPPFTTNLYVQPSQNLPLPPRIYPLFNNYMRPSQNLPLPPRIYPLFNKFICATEGRIILLAPTVTVGETEGAMDPASVLVCGLLLGG